MSPGDASASQPTKGTTIKRKNQGEQEDQYVSPTRCKMPLLVPKEDLDTSHSDYSLGPYQSSNPRSQPQLGVLTRFCLPFAAMASIRFMSSGGMATTFKLSMMRCCVTDLGRTMQPRTTW